MASRHLQDAETLAAANRAFESGDFAGALKRYRALARSRPDDAALLNRIGTCYGRLGQADLAGRHLRRAVEIEPTVTRWCDLATALQLQRDLDGAWAACTAALEMDPGHAWARRAQANLLLLRGDAAGARVVLDAVLSAGETAAADAPQDAPPAIPPEVAELYARTCRALRDPAAAMPVLERVLTSGRLSDDQRAGILFARADVCDATGRYDEAFAAYESANDLKASRARFDPDEHTRTVDRVIATWTAEAHGSAPRARLRNDQPVFILGMPRSGTSLVEQMLAAHPRIHGAGELGGIMRIADQFGRRAGARGDAADLLPVLNARDLNAAAAEYLRELTAGARSARRVTDKMPMNFLFLGLISLLAPRARVIHCVRDPIDTCLSCFFQNFAHPLAFSWNLTHLGRYYRDYQRLMTHWTAVVDVAVLEVVYEDLVAGPEAGARRLLEFLDVEWDDACLRFHESERVTITASSEQVREPVYRSSVARHRNYERHLEPLRRALAGLL